MKINEAEYFNCTKLKAIISFGTCKTNYNKKYHGCLGCCLGLSQEHRIPENVIDIEKHVKLNPSAKHYPHTLRPSKRRVNE